MDIICLSDSPNWVRRGHYLRVRQSQLGEAKSLFGCQTVPIGRDKYVIRLMSLFVHMVATAVDTLSWRLIGVALVPGQES